MFVNNGPSQQSCDEEYEPRKLGASARSNAFHTKTMLPTRKVCAKIQQACGPYEDLLTNVKKCKLKRYGHILPFIRSGQNHLARHSKMGKKTRQTEEEVGRQIREWTGLEFGKSQRAVKNRGKWRKMVAKLSVVPHRPSRLRDR